MASSSNEGHLEVGMGFAQNMLSGLASHAVEPMVPKLNGENL